MQQVATLVMWGNVGSHDYIIEQFCIKQLLGFCLYCSSNKNFISYETIVLVNSPYSSDMALCAKQCDDSTKGTL
jgi:hypothetical protein